MPAGRDQTEQAPKGIDWASACPAPAKQGLMIILVTCFVIQTCLVYFDATESSPLSQLASKGRKIWHQNNCQSCHQFYGFGGFLGPDLTNVSERLIPERLEQLLTEGSLQMPAFHMPPEEITAINAFLIAMNETGRGQARFGGDGPAARLVRGIKQKLVTDENPMASLGYGMFESRGCQGCHIERLNPSLVVPNLMDVSERLTRAEIMEVLENGRMPKMLRPFLTDEGREQTLEFLFWLGENRVDLQATADDSARENSVQWMKVPWWEFR